MGREVQINGERYTVLPLSLKHFASDEVQEIDRASREVNNRIAKLGARQIHERNALENSDSFGDDEKQDAAEARIAEWETRNNAIDAEIEEATVERLRLRCRAVGTRLAPIGDNAPLDIELIDVNELTRIEREINGPLDSETPDQD